MSISRLQAGDGRKSSRTRESIVSALREYATRYGQPTTASFNPATAKWRDDEESIRRYYAGRGDGSPWPSLNSIRAHFDGSFNAALEAAGLPPNKPGPSRRPTGMHAPNRTIREHIVVQPNERTTEANRRTHVAQERALRLEGRIARLAQKLDDVTERAVRAERKFSVVSERNVLLRNRGVVEAKVVEKPVKVKDEKALARLRSKLADSEAARKAVADQLKAALRDVNRVKAEAAEAFSGAVGATLEAQRAVQAENHALDRLEALERRLAALRDERDLARAAATDAATAAQIAAQVRVAEARAEAAETRTVAAEREMQEQAAVITGELRKLTAAEMHELRQTGPGGPTVLAEALKRLTLARKHYGDLDSALMQVARAALTWRERL